MLRIGCLADEAAALAGKVRDALTDGDVAVWAEEDGSVYVGPPGESQWVPSTWVAGVYMPDELESRIAADLVALAATRQ